MSRLARWEFFLTRWGQLYDFVAGTAKAAHQSTPQLNKTEVKGAWAQLL